MTILDVAGLTVEFLTGPQDAPRDFCVMRGGIPPGAMVPIHSHDSTGTFLVISGTKQALAITAWSGKTCGRAITSR
jgi:quercetin dioxygenase-like cupin family protein